AGKLKLDAAALEKTITEFNAAVQPGPSGRLLESALASGSAVVAIAAVIAATTAAGIAGVDTDAPIA
ncbi:hypothetical protein, partial [uncultured Bradyrhizobium sp.]|uniref:hypothetical protein n=1 Tax=uncultured Bradyrhizobium sp. TaxID=199684 RepID=UPI0026152880